MIKSDKLTNQTDGPSRQVDRPRYVRQVDRPDGITKKDWLDLMDKTNKAGRQTDDRRIDGPYRPEKEHRTDQKGSNASASETDHYWGL